MTTSKVVLARLRDLLLLLLCVIGTFLSGLLFLGYFARRTHNMLEVALGGNTVLLATLSIVVALAAGLTYVFSRPPCHAEAARRIKDSSGEP